MNETATLMSEVQDMKRRKWDPKKKFKAVVEGIKGRKIAEICNEYEISQAQYYKWRDQFLSHGHEAFNIKKASSRELRMANEINNLKSMVGELTMEVKKTEQLLA